MDLLPTSSRIAFCDMKGIPIPQPGEWMPALIEVLDAQEEWMQVQVWRQGTSLPVSLKCVDGQVRVFADWERAAVGHYRVQTSISGKREERILTILSEKITPQAYAQLLEDLETRLPTIIALGLQRLGALANVTLRPPGQATTLEQEWARLVRALEGNTQQMGLAKILTHLAPDPHRVLRTVEPWVKQERARQPSAAGLVQALARGGNQWTTTRMIEVPDRRVDHTHDVYENRLVRVYLHLVSLHLRRMVRLLRAANHNLLTEAEDWARSLSALQRHCRFLEDVTLPDHLPLELTMVVIKRPAYRQALIGYRAFHQDTSVHLDEPRLEAPLENLPYLYQVWATLQALTALLEAAHELGYTVRHQSLARQSSGGLFMRLLPTGQPLVVLTHAVHGTVVKLFSERSFTHHSAKQDPLRSVSFTQRPDVTLEVMHPGEAPHLYLFDPKYKLISETLLSSASPFGSSSDMGADNKTGTPQKVDIDKMHTYRDAICDLAGERVVDYAAILYPGKTFSYTPGLEAVQAYPGQEIPLSNHLKGIFRQALEWF